jgi:chaperonin GroES
MATSIKPLGTRVLVKRIEDEEQKSDGGIFLPDTAKEKPQEAEVVALGNGKNDEGEIVEFSVKVGDKVLISKYGGTEVKIDGDECPS